MNLDTVYTHTQKMFASGITTIIGSGLSCAYGLPGMGSLADSLRSSVPSRIRALGLKNDSWSVVEQRLAEGDGLEKALDSLHIDDPLIPLIVSLTAEIILAAEHTAVSKMLASNEPCAIRQLMSYITKTNVAANVVTTNYDRLVELACALADITVDTGFSGNFLGHYDEAASKEQLALVRRTGRRQPTIAWKTHIRLAKPHGSLDWYDYLGQPVRSEIDLDSRRLMITPGLSKYRSGYERPFDSQKNRAIKAIDGASSLLFVGYGFNDDHLQTHLDPRFGKGVRTTILTQELTDSALMYVERYPAILAMDMWPDDPTSTRARMLGETMKIEGLALWNLADLIPEVISP
ncbi:SIR2 family protein [Pseudarthrobacter sp. YS3]|uniref:SIR2 family protein n=1 Tax=Pseudarthrobacter sp. YS3 TaxID=3453718 RepID=UPI003EEED8FE